MGSPAAEHKEGFRYLFSLYGPKVLKVLVPLAAICFIYAEGHKEFAALQPTIALHLLEKLPVWTVLMLAAAGLCAVLLMTLYDAVFARHIAAQDVKLPWSKVWRVSWIANTFNNMMGFVGFTGAGIRLLLYKKAGVPMQELLRFLFLLSVSSLTGLSVLAWLVVLDILSVSFLYIEYPWLHGATWMMALYLPVYLLLSGTPGVMGKWLSSEKRLHRKSAILSAGASVLEWGSAGLLFALTAAVMGLHLSAAAAVGIFTLSATAGIFSLAPGGMGTLDLVMLVALGAYGANPDRALGALMLFRLFYYLLPWMIGLFLAAGEWMPRRDKLANRTQELWEKSVTGWQRFWGWPGQSAMLGDIGIWALSALVFVSGGLLLLSAATPGILHRMVALHQWVTPLTMKFSQQMTVWAGLMLIVLSRGIRLKLKRAYRMTLVLLAAGGLFSMLKGLDYEEAIFLNAVAVLLYISKSRFYRTNISLSKGKVLFWLLWTSVIAAAFYVVGDWTHPLQNEWLSHHRQLYQYVLKERELLRSAVVGFAGTWLVLTIWIWLSPKGLEGAQPTAEDMRRLEALLSRYPGNPLTHSLFLKDKNFFWSQDGEVLIPYGHYRNTLVALGDPVGNPDGFMQALREFRVFADKWALTPVFYQVTSRWLTLYHEFGCRFFKLGEEGFVDLQQFNLTGRSKADLRAVRNRFEREGFRFEVAEPVFQEDLIAELKRISDVWLEGRKEKGFSLGWFQPEYLQSAPVAVVRAPDGTAVAFASIMPAYDEGRTASVDLMRYTPQAGNGIMDFLFLQLFEWSKSRGFLRFNLGMAPLASVGEAPYALREERVANLVFRNANNWYKFKGIRRFKDKFNPDWETRYLAYPQGSSIVTIMINAMLLIHKASLPKRRAFLIRKNT